MSEVKMPVHVGLIMDGNRRWAKERGKKTIEGHLAGTNRILSLSKYIFKQGVKYLSIYAFSTANFNRDQTEVNYLMNLAVKFFSEKAKELSESNIKIIFSGRRDPLPAEVLKAMDNMAELTKNNTGGTLNIGLNYAGRAELVDAANKIREAGEIVTEESFSKYLYQDLPDIDFIIRTSGEQRMSDFFPWQANYAELYFPSVYWPDFDEIEFDKAITEYNSRKRRFGGN